MPRRATATLEPTDLEPTGTLICEGTVLGRAVPWKSPTMSRTGGVIPNRGYKAYKTWQEIIKHHVRCHRPRRKSWPYGGPVELRVTFYVCKRGGRSNADTSNLTKAFEDSLQGELYANDSQVHRIRAERVFTSTEPERVEYQLIAI